MTLAAVRALVAHYRRDLSPEEAHLVDRHMADVEALLRVVVGIVLRAVVARSPDRLGAL